MNQREAATRKIFKEKEFNLGSLGIGGLNAKFGEIFRRAFAYRTYPPHLRNRSSYSFFKQFLTVTCVPLKFIPLISQTWGKAR